MKTAYFSNCMAAFEGGGIRGAAHAGAYEAAVEAGIHFSHVAGTSAGSIVAALVAAGASASFVREQLVMTDFRALRGAPDKRKAPYQRGLTNPVVRLVLGRSLRAAIDAGGMFSTSCLQAWVEQCLRGAFREQGKPIPDHPVRFCDLLLPLYIVATDVLQKEPKIWSSENTRGDSVAAAVEASCAIPFYFQPVVLGPAVLVDGGAVSNLPTHILPRSSGHPGRFSDRVLAFRLKRAASVLPKPFEGPKDYALGLADALVTAATDIQQSLQTGVYAIDIDAGELRATDFDAMTEDVKKRLYENGKRAVREFIAREREIVGSYRIASQFVGFDERLLVYVNAFDAARETIWLSDSSTYWLWFIFPALAAALRRRVLVLMVAAPADAGKLGDEQKRRNLLRAMGCEVIEQAAISFTGALIDYPGEAATAVISSERGVVGQDFNYGEELIKVYRGAEDLPVIRTLGASMAQQVGQGDGKAEALVTFVIEPLPHDDLFAALRRVPQYRDARFEIQDLALDGSLRVSQTQVKEYKLLQVANLASELVDTGFELFAPCQYRLPDSSTSIITPPVVEITPQGPVMIEGHTRAFHSRQQGRNKIKAVIVDRVQAPLPVSPRPFHELRIARGTIEASANMPGFDRSLMRAIEAYVHA